jgi:hypothetical protein
VQWRLLSTSSCVQVTTKGSWRRAKPFRSVNALPMAEAGWVPASSNRLASEAVSAADQTCVADRGVAVIAWSVGGDLVGACFIDLGCTGVAPDPAISGRVGERRTELSVNERVVCREGCGSWIRKNMRLRWSNSSAQKALRAVQLPALFERKAQFPPQTAPRSKIMWLLANGCVSGKSLLGGDCLVSQVRGNGYRIGVGQPMARSPSMTGLPSPNTKRWVASRKAAVVTAVSSGIVTLEEVCRRYRMSEEEFFAWRRAFEAYGVVGLQALLLPDRPTRRHRPC